MSEMTAEMVIAALKAEPETYEWEAVLNWTDWATGEELRKLAKDLTDYIVQHSPRWENIGDDYWIAIPGCNIRLARGWRQICSEEFIPLAGWAVAPHEVRFVVDMLLEFEM